jgi:hypothetical protein
LREPNEEKFGSTLLMIGLAMATVMLVLLVALLIALTIGKL